MSAVPSDPQTISQAIAELVSRIDDVFGLFLDVTWALQDSVKHLEPLRERVASLRAALVYGDDDPNNPSTEAFHEVTWAQHLDRNSRGGANHVRMSQYTIALVYYLWEDEYRSRIAEVCGISRDQLLVPIFGDLRLLRNEIMHNGGVLSAETGRRMEVLVGLQAGQQIVFTSKQLHEVVKQVKAALDAFEMQHTGNDPRRRYPHHPARGARDTE